jgi:hypothetical protein
MFARIELFDLETILTAFMSGGIALVVAAILALAVMPSVNEPVEPAKPWESDNEGGEK